MGRTACTEPRRLYKGTLYLTFIVNWGKIGNTVMAVDRDKLRRMLAETVYR